MTTCTHGGDCTVHPDARGPHDFTPTAADALRRVWDALVSPHAVGMDVEATKNACAQVERVAREMGIKL